MFGKRKDGRVVNDIEPFQKIVPYIMRTRTDSMNMFEELIPCEELDSYIAEKKEEGKTVNYMHILIAAFVRTVALRPQLNRFVVRGKVFTRPKIWVSFVVHPTLKDNSAGTTIKLCFEGTETIFEVMDKIDDAVKREQDKAKTKNETDKLAARIMSLPSFLIRSVVNFLIFLDRHNALPQAVINASPFHTTFFITNMKSLGINPIYHHVYEFGTTGLFLAMGKEKKVPVVNDNDEIVVGKRMGINVVTDERFCDGLYFARSFRLVKKILANPSILEAPLDKKEEDCK